jgi:hypothetical protein
MKKLFLTMFLVSFLALLFAFVPPVSVSALSRPDLISPIGSASGDSVTFEWNYTGDVDEFRLEVWQEDTQVFKEYIDADNCTDGIADFGIIIDVGPGSNEIDLNEGYLYTWKVRAYKDTTSSAWSSTEQFWYELIAGYPAIMISPASGDIGTSVTIKGHGWQAGEDIEIFVDRDRIKTLRNVEVDWHTHITINDIGSQSIRAKGDESGWSNYCWFLVEGPDVTIDHPSTGRVGETIKVSGDNWPRNETISLSFNYRFVGSVSSGNGNWQRTFVIPEVPAGELPIEALSRTASAIDYFEVLPDLILSPESTGPAQPVMVRGTGFASQTQIRIALDTGTFYTSTNNSGSFTKEIKAPVDSGSFIVEARDGFGNVASSELSVGGIINVAPPVLNIGEVLTIRGTSFTSGRTVDIEIDSRQTESGTVDSLGNFTVTTKPILAAGRHTVTASDARISASATFEVESVAPGIPNPLQPFNNKLLFGTGINFSWIPVQDPSGVTYEIRVATDDSFQDIIGMVTVSGDRAALTIPTDGTYFWQVRTIDGAGNTSSWSSINSFTVRQAIGTTLWTIGSMAAAGAVAGIAIWQIRKRKVKN